MARFKITVASTQLVETSPQRLRYGNLNYNIDFEDNKIIFKPKKGFKKKYKN